MRERVPAITERCAGKTVLDIGCIGHKILPGSRERILHYEIRKVAKSVVGTDIEKYGHVKPDVIANAEKMDLHKKFDVVVAGEIIEHVSNPGLMLDSVKKHMNMDSLLIISTPNIFSTSVLIEYLLRRESKALAPAEHNFWFSEKLLSNLLEKNGFSIVGSERVIDYKGKPSIIGASVNMIAKIFGCGDCIILCARLKRKARL